MKAFISICYGKNATVLSSFDVLITCVYLSNRSVGCGLLAQLVHKAPCTLEMSRDNYDKCRRVS